MNLFHSSLHFTQRQLNQKGFTLPELLVAATISLGVVSLGGFGLISILSSSQVANAQNERRTELNRSLEFISAEVREANTIEKDASVATLPSDFTLPAGGENVLMLYPENSSSTPIIYYIASPTGNTWKGPKVVYRWGPQFNDDGTYQNFATPASWTAEPLIDAIEDTNTAPTCPGADWTANGTIGFGACVNALGKVAELSHSGVYNKPLQGSGVYKAQTTSIARSTQASTPSFDPPPEPNPTFTVTNGGVTTRTAATIDIEVLGGELTCDPEGTQPITKTARYNLTGSQVGQFPLTTTPSPSTSISVLPNTSLTIESQSTNYTYTDDDGNDVVVCSPNIFAHSKDHNLSQVLTLRNGDSIPDYAPFGDQRPIDSFLAAYIDTNKKVTIANNEVIFLFELGSTNSSVSYFDMQDFAVLTTITPNP